MFQSASSAIHSMYARLDICMVKVNQLEQLGLEQDQFIMFEELKSNLTELNKEKEILLAYAKQQALKQEPMDFATV